MKTAKGKKIQRLEKKMAKNKKQAQKRHSPR